MSEGSYVDRLMSPPSLWQVREEQKAVGEEQRPWESLHANSWLFSLMSSGWVSSDINCSISNSDTIFIHRMRPFNAIVILLTQF